MVFDRLLLKIFCSVNVFLPIEYQSLTYPFLQMFSVKVFLPMEYQSLTYPFLQMFCSVKVSRSKEAHSFKCFVV